MTNKLPKEEAEELGIHLTNACAVIDPSFDWDKQKIHLDRLIEDATKALEAREKKGREENPALTLDNLSLPVQAVKYHAYNEGLKKALEIANNWYTGAETAKAIKAEIEK